MEPARLPGLGANTYGKVYGQDADCVQAVPLVHAARNTACLDSPLKEARITAYFQAMGYVTIKIYFDPAEAELIRSRLEAAGYNVYVVHEVSEINTLGYSMAGEGIAVQVPEDQAKDATALLEAEEQSPSSEDSSSSPEQET